MAFLLLPLLGVFIYIIIAALVVGGIIFLIVTTVTGVQTIRDLNRESKEKVEEYKRWLESLPEEQRIIEQAKHEKTQKTVKIIINICKAVCIICIVIFILSLIFLN